MVWNLTVADLKDSSYRPRSLDDLFDAGFDRFDYKYYTWVTARHGAKTQIMEIEFNDIQITPAQA